LPDDDPNATYVMAAGIMGPVLAVALAIEARSGFRALLRTDVLMLVALYGLTLLEFLFPQPVFSQVISPEAAVSGTQAVLLGFAGIAVGRHFVPSRWTGQVGGAAPGMSPRTVFAVFLGSFILGYLYIFQSVNFNPLEVLRQMTLPRFYQDWGRARLGDWTSLVTELGLLIYLLPPIAGLVFARREEYKIGQKVVVFLVLALTLFYGFSGGTRSTFITYSLTFMASYLLFKRNVTTRQLIGYGAMFILVTGIAVYFMLEFRTVGLANYSLTEREHSETLFVDNNILTISGLTDVFPDKAAFLGFEIPYNALIRPIPRAFWRDKPEGLSLGIEDALGAEGLTLAATFIGESYMSAGFLGVVAASVLLGAIAGWWNRMGHDLDSEFKMLLYVSGFFAAALSMRSILQVVPAVLPTLALWTYGRIWLPRTARRKAEFSRPLARRMDRPAR
jgi:oligosaccharide repeat unit polymerase